MALVKARSIDAEMHVKIDEGDETNDEKSKTLVEKIKIVFTNITVEPVFILYLLPCTMAGLATQNLNLEKACRVNLKLGQEICDGLAERNSSKYNETHEIAVQTLVASMYAWKTVVQSLIPAIMLMFMGAWSDRHQRRKPCIIMPIFGEIMATTGFLICTYYFDELSMVYSILAEAVPPALAGGWFSMFMGVYSYVSTISSVETRTVRIGAINTFSNVSYTIGIAASGIVLVAIGFYGVFSLCLCMYAIGIIYGCIVIKDVSVKKDKVEMKGTLNFIKDFFDTRHIKETLRFTFKESDKKKRRRICLIMILVMVVSGPLHGEYTVLYFFVRYRFQWNEVDFSIYETYNAFVYTIGTIFSISLFSKYLKMDDALLGVISSLSKVFSALVYAFAPNSTIFYLGAIVEMLNGTSHVAMRSIISKLVPPEELERCTGKPNSLGKINSLFGISEALMPLAYGPLYSMVYNWTIHVVPGAFYLFGALLTLPAIFIFLWLYFEHKRDAKEAQKNEAQTEDLLNKETNIATS